ncbi:MAG TPA: GNAT family N-acetyltransferase [Acidimicrobiales bacterium]|nr:GNAT family N-acetyltransferase [Acidimicrobiales bacterium]
MTACPTLITERLILRPLEESDLGSYTDMLLAPEVHRSLHLPESFSRADAWHGMAAWRGQWELRGSGQWALEERVGGRFVGRAGLHRPEWPDWPGLEVGWALHPSWWGHGYATEAGHRSISYAFEVLDADEVFSVILPENRRSQAVAGRLGLSLLEERVLSSFPGSPHGIWRLGRDEWEAGPRPVSVGGGRRR